MLSEGTSIALACALLHIDSSRSLALLTVQPVRFASINANAAVLLISNVTLWSKMAVTLCMHHCVFLAVAHSPHHVLSIVLLILVIVILAQI